MKHRLFAWDPRRAAPLIEILRELIAVVMCWRPSQQ
jgi:hypothetical protein